MRKRRQKVLLWCCLTCLALKLAGRSPGGLPEGIADAQAVRVVARRPTPNTAVSSLTVAASPAAVSFSLVSNGVASGSSAVVITTTWGGGLCATTCTINLYGYFTNGNAALSGGSPLISIPASEVLGRVPTGSALSYAPFTQSNPLGGSGASLLLLTQSFLVVAVGGSRTDALSLQIDVSKQPQLPAGTYSGTLFLQAQSL